MTIQEILDELQIPFLEEGHEHCREGWIQLDCPYCSPNSEHWRLGFNLAYRYLNCWSCGRLSLLGTLAGLSNAPGAKIRKLLDTREDSFEPRRSKQHTGKLKLPTGLGALLPAHKRYLREERGFHNLEQLAELWELQGIGIHKDLAWRIFIPIHYHGRTVSWTTRSISDKHELRYLSASLEDESMPHKQLLYGEDYARHTIIVCEGPLDVWKIGPGAVGTFGTGFPRQQVARIAKYPRRVICYDAEPAAQKKAAELCDLLEDMPGETINVVLDSGKDPGEASKKELRKLRRLYL